MRIVILILLSALIPPASANDCLQSQRDIFAPSGKMPAGARSGECFLPQRRSYRLIHPDQAATVIPSPQFERISKTHSFIANVTHNKTFWIGAFPKDNGIESLEFMLERFKPRWLAAHSMLAVRFEQPITLFPQNNLKTEPLQIRSLVLSIDAVPLKNGPSYDLLSALQDNFGVATRLESIDDRIHSGVRLSKNPIERYALNFTAEERLFFWHALIEELHDPEMSIVYHLIHRNCMNLLFKGVDRVLNRTRGIVNRIATFYPMFIKPALKHRRILENRTLRTLNELHQEDQARIGMVVCTQSLKPGNDFSLDGFDSISP
jgi:hypothetical protein